jgi:hypothetical protein
MMFNDRRLTINGMSPDEITEVGERTKDVDAASPFPPKQRRRAV